MKLNPIYFLLAIVLIGTSLNPATAYCKSDSTVVLTNLNEFEAITFSSRVKAHITIKEGAKPEVKLRGSYEAFDYYRIDVTNKMLHIEPEKERYSYHNVAIYADIVIPTINDLELSGSSEVNIAGLLNTNKFSISSSGSTNVTIGNINTAHFDAALSGVSNVIVNNGTATKAAYALSGCSGVSAYNFVCQTVGIRASGTSVCKVNATKLLDVALSGASKTKYRGHPEKIEQSLSGSSKLRQEE